MSKESKERGGLVWMVDGQYCVTHAKPECAIPARLDGRAIDIDTMEGFSAIWNIGKRQQGVDSLNKIDIDQWICDICKQPLRLHKEGQE